MLVIYRLCSIPSTNPSPILQEDKFALNRLCLKSFVNAFKNVEPEVIFLGDFCGDREKEMIDEVCPFKHTFIPTQVGISETCLLQYKMALEQPDNLLFFLECDYLWNPDVDVKKFIEAVETLGVVSPYDHPNFYRERNIHSNQCEIELVADHHFRSVERNTMTFGIRKDILENNIDLFNEFGYLDHGQWLGLAKMGQLLYVPIPSMATHLVVDNLAPSVDWEVIWKTLI